MDKNRAVSVDMLNAYIKDVVGSFLLFFVVIGPSFYKAYYLDRIKQKEPNPE